VPRIWSVQDLQPMQSALERGKDYYIYILGPAERTSAPHETRELPRRTVHSTPKESSGSLTEVNW
jgi:hypothetical protein